MRPLRIFSVSFLLCFLAAPPPAHSQNPPADAGEISRTLLYLAPADAQIPASGSPSVLFKVQGFNYEFTPASGWKVSPNDWAPDSEDTRESHRKRKFELGGAEYILAGSSDDDRAILSLFRSGVSEPVATVVLWNREQLVAPWLPIAQQQKKNLTAAALRQDLEIADPYVYSAELSGDSLWVAVGHSTGEAEYGLGTIVRFDLKEGKAAVFQPSELATCAITHLVLLAPDSILLASRRQDEGIIRPCKTLARFEPSTGKLESLPAAGTLLENSVVTQLLGHDPVWVSTDRGICKSPAPASSTAAFQWTCWRVIPSIHVEEDVTVFNKPGDKGGSDLPLGDYEVLWANAAFFEIVTQDSYDAWLRSDDFQDLAGRNFDAEPWKLLNTSLGFAPVRPLAKPNAKTLEEGTLLYRAPVEKRPAEGAPAGWVKVRVRAGWVERADFQITPRILPYELPAPAEPEPPLPPGASSTPPVPKHPVVKPPAKP